MTYAGISLPQEYADLERAIVDQRCLTPFQRKIYQCLCRVPHGQVTTYRDLANAAECAGSRAVGQALRSNPLAPLVPCHRVIRSDLSPGGYAGETSGSALERKISLLQKEGVRFVRGRLADHDRLFKWQ